MPVILLTGRSFLSVILGSNLSAIQSFRDGVLDQVMNFLEEVLQSPVCVIVVSPVGRGTVGCL